MADSVIHWPSGLVGFNNTTTWTEGGHSQLTMNAAGEKVGIPVWFPGGKEIEEIEVALDAGTQADTLDLQIQGANTTHDTVNVTGFPDGTAITNGTADQLANKGGSNEVVTFTWTGTGPSPNGLHWIVIIPASAGAFSVEMRYCQDWGAFQNLRNYSYLGKQYLYDNVDWNNPASVGSPVLRIKYTDGTYETMHMCSPFTTIEQTANYRANSSGNAVGVKFTAPFDMELLGVRMAFSANDAYLMSETVLVNTSDTELARTKGPVYYIAGGYPQVCWFESGPISLTQGTTYRIYTINPAQDTNAADLVTMTIAAGEEAFVGLASGDFIYTTANDPPSEGGVGTWTDTTLEIPFVTLICKQDPNDLASGGGGGTVGFGHA